LQPVVKGEDEETKTDASEKSGPLAIGYIDVAVLFIVLGMSAITEPAVAGLGVTIPIGRIVAAFKGATRIQ
jgi:hypothetical protein